MVRRQPRLIRSPLMTMGAAKTTATQTETRPMQATARSRPRGRFDICDSWLDRSRASASGTWTGRPKQ